MASRRSRDRLAGRPRCGGNHPRGRRGLGPARLSGLASLRRRRTLAARAPRQVRRSIDPRRGTAALGRGGRDGQGGMNPRRSWAPAGRPLGARRSLNHRRVRKWILRCAARHGMGSRHRKRAPFTVTDHPAAPLCASNDRRSQIRARLRPEQQRRRSCEQRTTRDLETRRRRAPVQVRGGWTGALAASSEWSPCRARGRRASCRRARLGRCGSRQSAAGLTTSSFGARASAEDHRLPRAHSCAQLLLPSFRSCQESQP